MFRLLLVLVLVFIIGTGVFIYYNSQRTFEAKFKNIDGLPKGAQVTALGVKVGEVVRTKPTEDGIIVTVRITKKDFAQPPPGSQLTITSFRPNQGRILEIIPPNVPQETNAWIIQEPVRTESWLHAALSLLDGLKLFSEAIIKNVTPENFERVRLGFQEASESLDETVFKLQEYEKNLKALKNRFTTKAKEANELLLRLQKPISSLNKIVDDKNLTVDFKKELSEFTTNLSDITNNISSPDFSINLENFKVNILSNLNKINSSLSMLDQTITNSDLKEKIKNFNQSLESLNAFYNELNKQDIKKIAKEGLNKAKTATTNFEKTTSDLIKQSEKH